MEGKLSQKSESYILGELAPQTDVRLKNLQRTNAVARIFQTDASFWTSEPDGQVEVMRRLGWLDSPTKGKELEREIMQFIYSIQTSGITHTLLLGMGGSSLAPEVIAATFGVREDAGILGLDLEILDSTDPLQVRHTARRMPIDQTLYIVSSKSGTTSEVNAYFDYFWARARKRLGKRAGDHFIAITDPGTSLEKTATQRGVRKIFSADPNVGGRFSALTAFGLVPAALCGLNLMRLLKHAEHMMEQCRQEIYSDQNPGLYLGAILGEAALQGKDKLTIIADAELGAFGSWIEQLVAESTGKEGKGIIPVDLEPDLPLSCYHQDRIFVYYHMSGAQNKLVDRLKQAGYSVIEFGIEDEYQLGAEFYRWEFATAVACGILGVNAFDQPDVQDSKTRTQQKIAAFKKSKSFDEGIPAWQEGPVKVYGTLTANAAKARSLKELILSFISSSQKGDFIAINAYVPRNLRHFNRLNRLRKWISRQTGCATTLGFGPRFLHSTGQLHKGGKNTGLFIQITTDAGVELEIPGWELSFGTLERAQSLGDLEALLARGRRAIRIHLPNATRLDF